MNRLFKALFLSTALVTAQAGWAQSDKFPSRPIQADPGGHHQHAGFHLRHHHAVSGRRSLEDPGATRHRDRQTQ